MVGVFVDFSNFTKTINSISFPLLNFFADFLSLFVGWRGANPRLLNNEGNQDKESGVSVKDINLVMDRLGIECEVEDDHEDSDFVGGDELQGLFREEEPTLEEIRQVFEVFDENKDGYIDALELGKVLCNLGLLCKNEEHGAEDLKRCRKMLKSFDRYAVGLLDFDDFLKFMEMLLC